MLLYIILQEDEDLAAIRIYKTSVMFIGLALAFLIGISCVGGSSKSEDNSYRQLTMYHNE